VIKAWVYVALLGAWLAACGDNRGRAGGDAGESVDAAAGGGDGGGGGDDGGGGGGGSDADTDAAPALHITIHTGEPPALLAFREELSTQWQTVDVADRGTFDLAVRGPYRVVIACPRSARFAQVTQYARTPGDPRLIEHTCNPPRSFPFRVRGAMVEEGSVAFGSSGRGDSRVPWSFELPTSAGTFDLVLWFGSLTTGFDRVAIRRDLEITGDLQLGTIDATQERIHPLVSRQLIPLNREPDEQLFSTLLVQSGHTTSFTSSFNDTDAWHVRPVPAEVLRPTDSQRVQLAAQRTPSDPTAQQGFRSLTRAVPDGEATSVELMPPLTEVRFETTTERAIATWRSLPEHDELVLTREAFTDDFSQLLVHELRLTPAFLIATAATSATLDLTQVAGVGPEWALDPALQQAVFLDATRAALDEDALSSVSENIAPPTTEPTSRRRGAAPRPVLQAVNSDVPSPAEREARARAWRMAAFLRQLGR
jgi:hypothetical protein